MDLCDKGGNVQYWNLPRTRQTAGPSPDILDRLQQHLEGPQCQCYHYLITPSGVYSVKWTWQSRVSAAKRSRSVWSCFTSRALKRITLDHVSPSGPNPVALRQKAVFSQPAEKLRRGLRNLYSVHSPVHIHWTRTCHAHIHTSLSAATRAAVQECKKKNMVKPPCFAATNSVHPDCKLS